MATTYIKNDKLDGGINSELHPIELGLGTFTDGLNVRFEAGSVRTRDADTLTMKGNEATLVVDPALNLISLGPNWFYGNRTKLWGFDVTNIHQDLSRLIDDGAGGLIPDSYTSSPNWEFTQYGASIVACHEALDFPQIKIPLQASQPKTASFMNMPLWGVENVENDPAGIVYEWATKVIRSYKDFLICIGMTEEASSIHAGGEYPQRVRWSSTALPGQPPNSWNGATLETNAGWNDLSGISGSLVDGSPYQDAFVLFTEKELVLMEFVGGASIFTFRTIFDDGGLLARNCAIEFKGKQFCIGTNDVYVHDTSTKTSIATDVIKQRLYDEIGSTDTNNVRVHHEELRSEIWTLYSSVQAGDTSGIYPLDRAAVWNYSNNTWSFITLKDASGIYVGVRPESNLDAATSWDGATGSGMIWEDGNIPWSGRETGFGNSSTVYSSYEGSFYLADYLSIAEDGQHLERFIEKVGINVSKEVDRQSQLTKMLPVISSGIYDDNERGRVRLRVTGSMNQNETPDFDAIDVLDVTFDPNIDYKVDIRQSWAFYALRMDFIDPVDYQVHSLDCDTRPRSRR